MKYLKLFETFIPDINDDSAMMALEEIKKLRTEETPLSNKDGVIENNNNTIIIGNVKLRISTLDGYLLIDSLISKVKFKGYAGAVMQKICTIADKYSAYILLTTSPIGKDGLTYNQLIVWYSKFGFKEIGNSEMLRTPKTI
jgi:hypothetical protein